MNEKNEKNEKNGKNETLKPWKTGNNPIQPISMAKANCGKWKLAVLLYVIVKCNSCFN